MLLSTEVAGIKPLCSATEVFILQVKKCFAFCLAFYLVTGFLQFLSQMSASYGHSLLSKLTMLALPGCKSRSTCQPIG